MKLLFGVWLLFLPALILARADQPLRLEFISSGRGQSFHMVLAGDQGFIVLKNQRNRDNNKIVWKLLGFSSLMEQQWQDSLSLHENMEMVASDYDEDVAAMVFMKKSNQGTKVKEVWVDMSRGSVHQYEFHVEEQLAVRDYKTAGQQSFLLAMDISDHRGVIGRLFQQGREDEQPMVLIRMDRKEPEHEYICDVIGPGVRPLRLNVFHYKQNVDLYALEESPNGHHQVRMYTFSMGGNLLIDRVMFTAEGKSLVDVAVTSKDSMRFVAATVSSIRNRYNRYEDYTDGIYFCTMPFGREPTARLYTLANITSFYRKAHAQMFQFFPGRKDAPGSAGYPLQIHPDIKGDNNENILLAEAYYPHYLTQIYYDAYGMSRTRRVFNGYKYTHALALAFNNEADLLWHEAMEIKDVQTYSRRTRTDIISDGQQAGIIYSMNNNLRYQIVSNGKAMGDVGSVSLPLKYRNDVVKQAVNNNVRVWHGDFLLVYGYQNIENSTQGQRRVFFVQKVAFH